MTTEQTLTDAAVTQFAVLDALLAGAYESGVAVSRVRQRGDFGIGCCEHLGGEVIILDGDVFECTVDEAPDRMRDEQILPFVDVCHFASPTVREVAGSDLAEFTRSVESALLSRNLFHAVRADGVFASVLVRVTQRQEHPYRPLAEVTNGQIETLLTDVRGTLVGFWAPTIYQGITVAGLHIHFLADDRSVGGHVLDVTVDQAELGIAAYARFDLHLPSDDHFLRTELTHDEDHRIVTVEGGGKK
ncbi:acetolactate decarboxylase [Microbacterium endophyticum]|uniref:Alpha-acetolactate decarboxylase n=1 Tax=Microbacterium endophyticum TaxID=1526412 RepID=A0A7W4V4Q2_9MICO|nr:acetolactate decarboxylase [Microbacterium endophyticum]MBB2976489.1 acetolactate decarboxylase [Microbacterium endophyticum]NIK35935.1 acetolactate decarboxylase [Microbacterium endophyticum]